MFSAKKQAEKKLPPFPYEDMQGVQQEIPNFRSLKSNDSVRAYVHGELFEVLAEYTTPEQVEELMAWPTHVFDEWLGEWMKHAGVEPQRGKAPGGSPSSPRRSTGGRSKPKRS